MPYGSVRVKLQRVPVTRPRFEEAHRLISGLPVEWNKWGQCLHVQVWDTKRLMEGATSSSKSHSSMRQPQCLGSSAWLPPGLRELARDRPNVSHVLPVEASFGKLNRSVEDFHRNYALRTRQLQRRGCSPDVARSTCIDDQIGGSMQTMEVSRSPHFAVMDIDVQIGSHLRRLLKVHLLGPG